MFEVLCSLILIVVSPIQICELAVLRADLMQVDLALFLKYSGGNDLQTFRA
jgi:hypothetical protein